MYLVRGKKKMIEVFLEETVREKFSTIRPRGTELTIVTTSYML